MLCDREQAPVCPGAASWEDTAVGDGGKQGSLLWVNKQHCVWGSDCQQGAVPLAS